MSTDENMSRAEAIVSAWSGLGSSIYLRLKERIAEALDAKDAERAAAVEQARAAGVRRVCGGCGKHYADALDAHLDRFAGGEGLCWLRKPACLEWAGREAQPPANVKPATLTLACGCRFDGARLASTCSASHTALWSQGGRVALVAPVGAAPAVPGDVALRAMAAAYGIDPDDLDMLDALSGRLRNLARGGRMIIDEDDRRAVAVARALGHVPPTDAGPETGEERK